MASKKHSNNSEVITLSGTIKGGSAPGPKPKPKPKPKQKPPANETRIRTPKKAAGRVAINLPFLGEASASWMKPVQFDRWARDTSHKPRAMAINTTAPQTVVPNYYMEKRRADNGEDCTALFGTDAVTSLVLSADATPGDILFQIGLTPFLFPETRLYTLCQLWERFRFIRLQFEYVPIASSFNSGQLLGFYDSDIQVSWVSGTANFQKASALGVQGPNQVSQDKTWNIPDPAFTNMFTNQGGVDLRLQQQGQFIIMANSILDHTVTPSLGNLYIRYEVELFSPCSSQAPVAYTSTLGGGASPGTAPFGLTAPYDGRFFNNLPVTYDNNGGTRSDFTFNGSGQAGSVFVLFLNVRYSGTIWTTVGLNEVGLGTAFVTESTTAANTVQFTYAYSVLTPDFTWGFSLTGGAFTIVSTRVTFNLGPQVGLSPLSEMRALLAEQAKEKVRRRDNLENEVNALKMQLAEFIESRSAPLRKDNKRLSSPSGSRIRVLREYDSVEEGETDVV